MVFDGWGVCKVKTCYGTVACSRLSVVGDERKKTKLKKGSERNNKHREPRKEYCERGRVFKHFQVRGHRFSPYGLTESPQITTFGLFTQLCR